MGLFDLFSKKQPSGPTVKDLTWISKKSKWNGALALLAKEPEAIFVSWFTGTANEFGEFARSQNIPLQEIRDARRVMASSVENKTVIFLEHYPIRSKEELLIENWQAKNIYVLNALDEPLMLKAGGANIAALMTKMGLSEDESLDHKLIGQSIKTLQEKLEKNTPFESSSSTAEEWFRRNGNV